MKSEVIPFDKKERKKYLKRKKKAQEKLDRFFDSIDNGIIGYIINHGNEISEALHNIIEEAEREDEEKN